MFVDFYEFFFPTTLFLYLKAKKGSRKAYRTDTALVTSIPGGLLHSIERYIHLRSFVAITGLRFSYNLFSCCRQRTKIIGKAFYIQSWWLT